MKNKALLYGLAGGLAVLLYFKFGRKKSGLDQLSNEERNELDKKIEAGDRNNAQLLKLEEIKKKSGSGTSYSFPPENILTVGENASPLVEITKPQVNYK